MCQIAGTIGGVGNISTRIDQHGIAEVVMDRPPVNALTVAQWFEVADQVTAAGRNSDVRVVVLRAEGKGFNPIL